MHFLIAPAGQMPGLPPELFEPLDALLADAELLPTPVDEPLDPHTPLERLLGGLRGLAPDAALPLAAWRLADRTLCWSFISPLHLQIEASQVLALRPELLALDEAQSHQLFEALAPLFPRDEGWEMAWLDPLTWAVAHPQLDGLQLASLARIADRPLTPWLPEDRRIRRWTNEAQMLLHAHPLNAQRAAAGQLPVNSIWWWGAGRHAGEELPADLHTDSRLAGPLMAQDSSALASAWQALQVELPRQREPWLLSLAGERGHCSLRIAPRPWWQRWRRRGPRLASLLEAL